MERPDGVSQAAGTGGDPESESNHGGLTLQSESSQAGHRDVRTEEQDGVAETLQDVGNHLEPEHVVLALDGCQQNSSGRRRSSPRGCHRLEQSNQGMLADGGGEMFVGDADVTLLPHHPDADHRGGDDQGLNDLRGQARIQRLRDEHLGCHAVAHAQDPFESAGEDGDAVVGPST